MQDRICFVGAKRRSKRRTRLRTADELLLEVAASAQGAWDVESNSVAVAFVGEASE